MLGPATMAQEFVYLLEKKSANKKLPVVLNVTSAAGSINAVGSFNPPAVYSMTKAALNMLVCLFTTIASLIDHTVFRLSSNLWINVRSSGSPQLQAGHRQVRFYSIFDRLADIWE